MKTAMVEWKYRSVLLITVICTLAGNLPLHSQTGGTYRIEKSVVAPGGDPSTGGSYSLESTSGQPAAGRAQSPPYSGQIGFWASDLAPTAAGVPVGGRVLTPEGEGLANAGVTMIDRFGNARMALTSAFGYYLFEDVEVGYGYVFQIRAKRYQFASAFVVVTDEMTDLNFQAEPGIR